MCTATIFGACLKRNTKYTNAAGFASIANHGATMSSGGGLFLVYAVQCVRVMLGLLGLLEVNNAFSKLHYDSARLWCRSNCLDGSVQSSQ